MAFQPLNQHWHLAALMQKLLQIIQCLHHFHSSLLSHSSQSLARLWVFDAPPRRPQIPAHPLKYCACLQPENLMFARHESTLSSQVEGTHSTLEDVLEFEVSGEGHRKPKDAQEIVNYVRAMNYGNDAGIG